MMINGNYVFPMHREFYERVISSIRSFRVCVEPLDAAEAGNARAKALAPLKRAPCVPPPRSRCPRIAGLDIKRFIPRRT